MRQRHVHRQSVGADEEVYREQAVIGRIDAEAASLARQLQTALLEEAQSRSSHKTHQNNLQDAWEKLSTLRTHVASMRRKMDDARTEEAGQQSSFEALLSLTSVQDRPSNAYIVNSKMRLRDELVEQMAKQENILKDLRLQIEMRTAALLNRSSSTSALSRSIDESLRLRSSLVQVSSDLERAEADFLALSLRLDALKAEIKQSVADAALKGDAPRVSAPSPSRPSPSGAHYPEFTLYEVLSGQAAVVRMSGEEASAFARRLERRLVSLSALEKELQSDLDDKAHCVRRAKDEYREAELRRLRLELQMSNLDSLKKQREGGLLLLLDHSHADSRASSLRGYSDGDLSDMRASLGYKYDHRAGARTSDEAPSSSSSKSAHSPPKLVTPHLVSPSYNQPTDISIDISSYHLDEPTSEVKPLRADTHGRGEGLSISAPDVSPIQPSPQSEDNRHIDDSGVTETPEIHDGVGSGSPRKLPHAGVGWSSVLEKKSLVPTPSPEAELSGERWSIDGPQHKQPRKSYSRLPVPAAPSTITPIDTPITTQIATPIATPIADEPIASATVSPAVSSAERTRLGRPSPSRSERSYIPIRIRSPHPLHSSVGSRGSLTPITPELEACAVRKRSILTIEKLESDVTDEPSASVDDSNLEQSVEQANQRAAEVLTELQEEPIARLHKKFLNRPAGSPRTPVDLRRVLAGYNVKMQAEIAHAAGGQGAGSDTALVAPAVEGPPAPASALGLPVSPSRPLLVAMTSPITKKYTSWSTVLEKKSLVHTTSEPAEPSSPSGSPDRWSIEGPESSPRRHSPRPVDKKSPDQTLLVAQTASHLEATPSTSHKLHQATTAIPTEPPASLKALERTPKPLVSTDHSFTSLMVFVVEARNLPVMKRTSRSSDPFVELYFTDSTTQRYRTGIQWGTLSPSWTERFSLVVGEHDKTITFDIIDASKSGDLEPIGQCSVKLGALADGKLHVLLLPMVISCKRRLAKVVGGSFLKVQLQMSAAVAKTASAANSLPKKRAVSVSNPKMAKGAAGSRINSMSSFQITGSASAGGLTGNNGQLKDAGRFGGTISRGTLSLLDEFPLETPRPLKVSSASKPVRSEKSKATKSSASKPLAIDTVKAAVSATLPPLIVSSNRRIGGSLEKSGGASLSYTNSFVKSIRRKSFI